MTDDQEVIDVEEYHHILQRKSESTFEDKILKLKEENKVLETKLNKISHANDALHRQLYEQTQQQRRVAQLLGFDDLDPVEAGIAETDPWTSGGRSRVLSLEERIAKFIMESGNDAQAVRVEMGELLKGAQEEAQRLRQGRDFARREAERHAADGLLYREELHVCRDNLQKYRDELQFWRNEVNTKLPEMQALLREQRTKTTLLDIACNSQKENVACHGDVHASTLFGEVANTRSSLNKDTTSILDPGSDMQYYKNQYQLLETKYNDLLASKGKISRRYLEDLKKWKNFKQWLVKDSGNAIHRGLGRRKIMEEIGPKTELGSSYVEDSSVRQSFGQDGLAEDPDVPFPDRKDYSPKGVEDDLENGNSSAMEASYSHTLPPLAPGVSSQCLAPMEESLTQLSSIPPASQGRPPHEPIPGLSGESPLSQSSVTQKSSPVRKPTDLLIPVISDGAVCLRSQADPIERQQEDTPKQIESEESVSPNVYEGKSKKEDTLLYEPDETSRVAHLTETRLGCTAPRTRQRVGLDADEGIKSCLSPLHCDKRLPTEMAAPESLHAIKFGEGSTHVAKSEVRRVTTVLAADTPPRPNPLFRHHSSPPDSPSIPYANYSPSTLRKRKAAEMEDTTNDANQGNNSDPFIVGPSRSELAFQGGERRGMESHNEYIAKYMPYKGRGRYSGTKAHADKTINHEFEIDPERNDGVNYQFDAVVRDRVRRKNLDAIDCECCRDYYEALGPLPPRLNPPKWRSPSHSQEERFSTPRRHQEKADRSDPLSPSARAKAIESHRHEISRHRHDWAPPTTPPSYWRIGFPNTQEVNDINRQANDMHARKLQQIEAGVRWKTGKYRRRQ